MKHELTPIEVDGYWVIGTNKWSVNIYTKEQAIKYNDTLLNCNNCINCLGCTRCSWCIECSRCLGCSKCSGCSECTECTRCSGCSECTRCSGCIECSRCLGCSECSRCLGCSKCSWCSWCSWCSGFKSNPERITSPIVGSRDSQTTYYWTKEHEQVVCGCFKGTLIEFEAKVKETHGDNEHGINYINWINKVKAYKA